jgi:S1-C subfamily serine protease
MRKYLAGLLIGIIIGMLISSLSARIQSHSRIIEKLKSSIVPIILKQGNGIRLIGTGFVFSSKQYIVTNAHIVHYARLNAKTEDLGIALPCPAKGKDIQIIIPCNIVKENSKADIAILSPEFNLPDLKPKEQQKIKNYLQPVHTRMLKGVKIGQEVLMGGFPMSDRFGSFHSFHKGIVSKIDTLDTSDMSGTWAIQTDIVSFEGFSGAPLFLANTGEVIGVIWGGINVEQNKVLACATPIDYLLNLLK